MSYQVVKQPNGLFAIWSTAVDTFVLVNAFSEDIINFFRMAFIYSSTANLRMKQPLVRVTNKDENVVVSVDSIRKIRDLLDEGNVELFQEKLTKLLGPEVSELPKFEIV